MSNNTDLETSTSPITTPSNDDKNIATITHLAGAVFSFIPSLMVWMLKKDDSEYIATQAKEALNFQISILVANFVACVLMWVLIGFLLFPIIWLVNIVLCVIAAISTSKGENYRYPLSLRLLN